MHKTLFTGLLATAFVFSGWAAGSNLLTNGNLMESPNPAQMPSVEDHDNTWKAPIEPGSSLPGFKATRSKVYLVLSKQSNKRWIDLNGGGGVTQTLGLTPNRTYRLRFTLEGDPRGYDDQSVAVEAEGLNGAQSVKCDGRRIVTAQFTPTTGQSAVEIYATGGGRGPRVYNLTVEAQ